MKSTQEEVHARRHTVAQLRAMGMSNQEMAQRLGVSLTTITNDVTAMGLASHATRRTNGRKVTNPLVVASRILSQLDDLADALLPVVDQIRAHDYGPDPELLDEWDTILNRRHNITAVVNRLRSYVKEST